MSSGRIPSSSLKALLNDITSGEADAAMVPDYLPKLESRDSDLLRAAPLSELGKSPPIARVRCTMANE